MPSAEITNPRVNRYLTHPGLDDVDHALGRPKYPLRETYRNYYAIDPDTNQAEEMLATGWWDKGQKIPGELQMFHVNAAGKRALALYLS